MTTTPTESTEAMLLRMVNAARSSRQHLEGIIADYDLDVDPDILDDLERNKADEQAGMAHLEANYPKCPGCGQAFAFQRQPKALSRCRWCGYDHETGERSRLVPA